MITNKFRADNIAVTRLIPDNLENLVHTQIPPKIILCPYNRLQNFYW